MPAWIPKTPPTGVTLRPLERGDLHFVHVLNNNRSVMGYWFEEPYESFVELEELYRKHIHDQSERRFIVEDGAHERVGLVELVEIDHLHRRAEFLIMISPEQQNHGYAREATRLAINYAFRVLNLYKLYLLVDVDNDTRDPHLRRGRLPPRGRADRRVLQRWPLPRRGADVPVPGRGAEGRAQAAADEAVVVVTIAPSSRRTPA